ncbi:hypothetical protein C8J57DRAFT_1232591 [Mycena rebaudengoi]|nr:hypothetical protein C8J57DRAFT_1232591 [Mycena rebaudengoi]
MPILPPPKPRAKVAPTQGRPPTQPARRTQVVAKEPETLASHLPDATDAAARPAPMVGDMRLRAGRALHPGDPDKTRTKCLTTEVQAEKREKQLLIEHAEEKKAASLGKAAAIEHRMEKEKMNTDATAPLYNALSDILCFNAMAPSPAREMNPQFYLRSNNPRTHCVKGSLCAMSDVSSSIPLISMRGPGGVLVISEGGTDWKVCEGKKGESMRGLLKFLQFYTVRFSNLTIHCIPWPRRPTLFTWVYVGLHGQKGVGTICRPEVGLLVPTLHQDRR